MILAEDVCRKRDYYSLKILKNDDILERDEVESLMSEKRFYKSGNLYDLDLMNHYDSNALFWNNSSSKIRKALW
ncbi:unnamed protein product, partial [Didymodactylos carnosus]